MSFQAIIDATNRTRIQFDANGSPEDNRDVLKELAIDFFRAFSGLVEDAGGDTDIIKTWLDGVPSDLDYAFGDAIEKHGENVTMFKPRRGLGAVVHGARL